MIVQQTKDTLSLLHNQLTCLDRPCSAGQTRKTADPWRGFGFLANLKKRPWHIFQESRSLLWRLLCKREVFPMYKRRKTKSHPYFLEYCVDAFWLKSFFGRFFCHRHEVCLAILLFHSTEILSDSSFWQFWQTWRSLLHQTRSLPAYCVVSLQVVL